MPVLSASAIVRAVGQPFVLVAVERGAQDAGHRTSGRHVDQIFRDVPNRRSRVPGRHDHAVRIALGEVALSVVKQQLRSGPLRIRPDAQFVVEGGHQPA